MKQRIKINHLIDKFSSNPFVVGKSTYTYKSFFERVQIFIQRLKSLEIEKGSIVIIHDVNPEETVFLLFALFSLKIIAFPVNPKTGRDELVKIKNASKAPCIISNNAQGNEVINPSLIFEEVYNEKVIFKIPEWDYEIPALMILTSGSSGEPKMVVHSLDGLLFSATKVNTYFDLQPKNRWLLSLPLYHVAGLAVIFRCFLGGATLSIPLEKMDMRASLEKFRPTHVSLVPTQLWRLLSNTQSVEILKRCKVIFLGGSTIPQSLIINSLENSLQVYTSYGLTEIASTVAIKKVTDYSTDKAEILLSYKVKIAEDNEILLKSDALFLGYLENGTVKKSTNKAGWFETGDLGELQDNNLITVYGRKDNMFISGGENIYPEEIEKYLLMIEEIEKAVVVAVEDNEFGQRPLAFIKMNNKINQVAIRGYLKKHCPSYKIPDRFLPWPKDYIEKEFKVKRQYFKSLL